MIWPIQSKILMILTLTKYLENLLRGSVLFLLSIATKVFILGRLQHLFTLFYETVFSGFHYVHVRQLFKWQVDGFSKSYKKIGTSLPMPMPCPMACTSWPRARRRRVNHVYGNAKSNAIIVKVTWATLMLTICAQIFFAAATRRSRWANGQKRIE